ncbi:MAG: HEAT repeat domain-containing protein [Elusimicrobiota bacterium]
MKRTILRRSIRADFLLMLPVLLLAGCAGGLGWGPKGSASRSSGKASSAANILPVLVQSLQHDNPEIRYKSVVAIDELGAAAETAAPDLIFLLDDPVRKVRESAADALVKIGPGAVAPLIAAVKDKRYPGIRQGVFPVLAKMGGQAAPALPALQNAAQESDPNIQSMANAAINVISRRSGGKAASKGKFWRWGRKSKGERVEKESPAVEPQAAPAPPPPAPQAMISGPISIGELVRALSRPEAEYRRQAVANLEFKEAENAEVLPVLIHVALNDTDDAVRAAAAGTLKELGAQPASVLILSLTHPDAKVRQNAVSALGVIGPVTDSVIPALMDACLDGKTQDGAVTALSNIGLPAVPALIKALSYDAAQGSAGKALVRIGRPAAPAVAQALADAGAAGRAADALAAIGAPAVPALLDSFAAGEHKDRSAVLVRIGRPAVPLLITALREREEKIRQSSGLTLCQMGPSAADALPAFIEVLKKHRSEVELYPLWRFGAAGAPALIEATRDKSPEIRLLAFQSLAQLSPVPEEAVPSFIVALHDTDQRIGDFAVIAIKDLGDQAVPALTAALRSPVQADSRSAAEALGFIGEPARKAIEPLREALLRHADAGVRKRAAFALGALDQKAKSAVPDLIAALEDEPVRWWAAEALRKIGPAAVPALTRMLHDDMNPLQFRAALMLTQLAPGHERIPVVLLSALQAEDPGVRYQSALALGANPGLSEQSIPALIRVLEDADAGVRFAAAAALGRLGAPAVEPLLRAAVKVDSPLSPGAMNALRMLDSAAAPALTASLKDKATRALASDTLLRMGPKAVPSLIAELDAAGPRGPAGSILARMGNDAVPALKYALTEGRDALKRGAALTLKEIGTPEALAGL